MKKLALVSPACMLLFAIILIGFSCTGGDNKSQPDKVKSDVMMSDQNGAFLNHRDSVPSKKQYDGPLFVLSHDYPTIAKPVVNPSWQKALNGQPISASNVFAYLGALKSYVAPNVLPFFENNRGWTAAKYGWFNEPWLGSQREAILGTYFGNGNLANMFKSLKVDEQGYALVLYDSTAAYTVGQI